MKGQGLLIMEQNSASIGPFFMGLFTRPTFYPMNLEGQNIMGLESVH